MSDTTDRLRAELERGEQLLFQDIEAAAQVLRAAGRALEAAEPDGMLFLRYRMDEVLLLSLQGHPLEAIAVAEAIRTRAAEGDPGFELRLLNALGNNYDLVGQPEQAIAVHREALAAARVLGDIRAACRALGNLAVATSRSGDDAGALELYDQCLEEAEAGDVLDYVAQHGSNAVVSCLALDQLDRAEAYLHRTGGLVDPANLPSRAHVHAQQALVRGRRGQVTEGLAEARVALEISRKIRTPEVVAFSAHAMCELLSHPDRPAHDEAVEVAREARRTLETNGTGVASFLADVLRIEASALERAGRFDEAVEVLEELLRAREAMHAATRERDRDLARSLAAAHTMRLRHEALAAAHSALMKHTADLGDQLAGASHDLRSPLTVVAMAASELAQSGTPDVVELATYLQGSVARMVDIVDNLLRSQAPDVGVVATEAFDLSARCRQVVLALRPLARAKGIDMSMELVPTPVQADPTGVDRVLRNLLDNAIKFSEPGRAVRVWCGIRGGRRQAEIADRGPGLSPADKERAFGRYARLSAQPTGGESSVGLGLYVSRRLMRGMGGDIEVVDREGGGAVFRIWLPETAPP